MARDCAVPNDVRESMRRLPRWIQPLLTLITGKPAIGEKPMWIMTPVLTLAIALAWLFGGALASVVILQAVPWNWPLLLVTWMATVCGARTLLVEHIHAGVHGTLLAKRRLGRLLANVLSAMLMVQDLVNYTDDHLRHHGEEFATPDDADASFLIRLGFRPGMTREALWRRLAWMLVSPWFHYMFLRARLKANFVGRAWPGKLMALTFMVVPLGFALVHEALWIWVLAWAFPLTCLYHISALLQFTGEHFWMRQPGAYENPAVARARLSHGRFMGEVAPAGSLPLREQSLAWAWWLAKMLFLHLPSRFFVVVGGLPAHDYHHRHATSRDWPNSLYARQRDVEAGPTPAYIETWGLLNSIDAVFTGLSGLAPMTVNAESLKINEAAGRLNTI